MLTLDEIRRTYPLPPGWEWRANGPRAFIAGRRRGGPRPGCCPAPTSAHAPGAARVAWFSEPAYAALVIATGVAHLFRWYLAPGRERCGNCRSRRYDNSGLWCGWWRSPNHGESVGADDWCIEHATGQ